MWKTNLRNYGEKISKEENITNGIIDTKLNVSYLYLLRITDLSFRNLSELNCSFNELTNLPKLPETLKILLCNNNQLTSLINLPLSLKFLDCSCNPIKYTDVFDINVNLNKLYIQNTLIDFDYKDVKKLNNLKTIIINEDNNLNSDEIVKDIKIIKDDYKNIYYDDKIMLEIKEKKIKSFRNC